MYFETALCERYGRGFAKRAAIDESWQLSEAEVVSQDQQHQEQQDETKNGLDRADGAEHSDRPRMLFAHVGQVGLAQSSVAADSGGTTCVTSQASGKLRSILISRAILFKAASSRPRS